MTNDVEVRKEVFAWFGGAAYAAQCFEAELCILHLLLHLLNRRGKKRPTEDEMEKVDAELSRKTLGQLLRRLREVLVIDPDFEKMLREYLDKRNYLMHRFFSVHGLDLLSRQGCDLMISELKELNSSFKEADEIAKGMSRNVRKHLGIPEEYVEQWVEAVLEKTRAVP